MRAHRRALIRRELLHPLVRTEAQVAARPFVAVYLGTEGLPASRHAACAHAALAYADELTDPLPPALLTRYRMPAKAQAVRAIHAPQNAADLPPQGAGSSFEELYLLQIGIFLRSHGRNRTSAPMQPLIGAVGAVRRTCPPGAAPLDRGDRERPVRRGADEPAFAGRCRQRQNASSCRCGHLVCRPERLAERPAGPDRDFWPGSMPRWPTGWSRSGVNVTLLVGGMKAKERRIALSAIAGRPRGLVVGTHAVLTDTVEFKKSRPCHRGRAALAGVRQRGLLAGKARKARTCWS